MHIHDYISHIIMWMMIDFSSRSGPNKIHGKFESFDFTHTDLIIQFDMIKKKSCRRWVEWLSFTFNVKFFLSMLNLKRTSTKESHLLSTTVIRRIKCIMWKVYRSRVGIYTPATTSSMTYSKENERSAYWSGGGNDW